MPNLVKVYEKAGADPEKEPARVHDRFPIDAAEMCENDPGRYRMSPWPKSVTVSKKDDAAAKAAKSAKGKAVKAATNKNADPAPPAGEAKGE